MDAIEAHVTQSGQLWRTAVLVVCVIAITIAVGALSPHVRRGAVRLLGKHFHSAVVAPDRMGLPHLMFWAWERPDDLSLLDTKNTGVAFLAGTIFLRPIAPGSEKIQEEGVVLRPRLQPLRIPDGIPLMAVVRIETPLGWSQMGYQPPAQTEHASGNEPYTEGQRQRVVSMISSFAGVQGVRAVQIDFDATRREHAFYRSLLEDLRKQLPPGTPISITALASWCIGDPWLEELPAGTIDEAVPMLFRMGPDARNISSFLNKGNEFRVTACRGSLGLSTDETFSLSILRGEREGESVAIPKKRIYVFLPKTWTKETVQTTMEEWKRWHDTSSASR
jgi:hypothetical protein